MTEFPKYGDIENLYRNSEILQHEVVVTEKIHGTNCRIMWTSKGMYVGGRNHKCKDPSMEHPSKYDGFGMTTYFENHPSSNPDTGYFSKNRSLDGYTFYGEFHGPGIQKGVKYCEQKDFRVFDIRDPQGSFIHWNQVEDFTKRVGFKLVPVLFKGYTDNESLKELLDIHSKCATDNGIELENNIAEGVVIRPLQPVRDIRGNWLRAKYKSDKFAENTKTTKVKQLDPEIAKLQVQAREFASQVATMGRVHTIVDHITRDGDTTLNLKRTPDFLRAFIKDIMKEYPELYSNLDKKQTSIINKVVSQAAVKLWQEYLVESTHYEH